MRRLKQLYYFIFPTYIILEKGIFTWDEADKLIRENDGKPESEQWVIAKEDKYYQFPLVALERKKRIYD